jgi:hypothetical protein
LTEQQRVQFGAGFVIDAWLANWDVGAAHNLLSTPEGFILRIDNGGGGLFRALGEPKGEGFTDAVLELDTMRHPRSVSSFAFGGLAESEMGAQVKKFVGWYTENRDRISRLIDESGLSSEMGAKLKEKLHIRAAWLEARSR